MPLAADSFTTERSSLLSRRLAWAHFALYDPWLLCQGEPQDSLTCIRQLRLSQSFSAASRVEGGKTFTLQISLLRALLPRPPLPSRTALPFEAVVVVSGRDLLPWFVAMGELRGERERHRDWQLRSCLALVATGMMLPPSPSRSCASAVLDPNPLPS